VAIAGATRTHISCRIAHRSWKIGLNNDSFRNGTPGDPPVPFFAPIVLSTNLTLDIRTSTACAALGLDEQAVKDYVKQTKPTYPLLDSLGE
jgi:hypothetical protein